jgi:hypothetical protein
MMIKSEKREISACSFAVGPEEEMETSGTHSNNVRFLSKREI